MRRDPVAERARGALAGAFKLIEDAAVCERMEIRVAAVDAEARELYVNSRAQLSQMELRFVMAHELLRVSLRHQARRQGRDPKRLLVFGEALTSVARRITTLGA